MDRTESIGHEHLKSQGFSDIIFEPDGNVPPDFLLDGSIAVEVRRLNENERDRAEPRGLEEVGIPLNRRLEKIFASYGTSTARCWWILLEFKRPIPSLKDVEAGACSFLDGVVADQGSNRTKKSICQNVVLEAIPRPKAGGRVFSMAIAVDDDSGGFVIEELERNLRLCITEKTKKIAPVRQRYAWWWLLLVDYTTFTLSEYDRRIARQEIKVPHDWTRLLIVNPLNPEDYLEL